MAFLESIINQKKHEVWARLAKETGGEISEKFWTRNRMYTHYKNWISMLDVHERPGYQFGGYQTRLRIPVVNIGNFHLDIDTPGFLSKILDKFDTKIIPTNEPNFDKHFNIHISNEELFPQVINKEVMHLIWNLRPINIYFSSGADSDGLSASAAMLSIQKDGRITDYETLKSMFQLKHLLLDTLEKVNIISSESTEVDSVEILESMVW